MKKQELCVAGLLTLVVSGSASAGLVAVSVIAGPSQHPDGKHNTWQVIASFTDQGDRISAVNGLDQDGLNALVFWTSGGELYNQALFDGLSLNDYASVGLGGEAYDSYITLGNTNIGNVGVTPNFLGGNGTNQVILGSAWTETDGAWYSPQGPLEVGLLEDAIDGNDTSDVVIAQFTVDAGVGLHFEGNIAWLDPASGGFNTPFLVKVWPTPGALALFGIAGICGIRRRRG